MYHLSCMLSNITDVAAMYPKASGCRRKGRLRKKSLQIHRQRSTSQGTGRRPKRTPIAQRDVVDTVRRAGSTALYRGFIRPWVQLAALTQMVENGANKLWRKHTKATRPQSTFKQVAVVSVVLSGMAFGFFTRHLMKGSYKLLTNPKSMLKLASGIGIVEFPHYCRESIIYDKVGDILLGDGMNNKIDIDKTISKSTRHNFMKFFHRNIGL